MQIEATKALIDMSSMTEGTLTSIVSADKVADGEKAHAPGSFVLPVSAPSFVPVAMILEQAISAERNSPVAEAFVSQAEAPPNTGRSTAEIYNAEWTVPSGEDDDPRMNLGSQVSNVTPGYGGAREADARVAQHQAEQAAAAAALQVPAGLTTAQAEILRANVAHAASAAGVETLNGSLLESAPLLDSIDLTPAEDSLMAAHEARDAAAVSSHAISSTT